MSNRGLSPEIHAARWARLVAAMASLGAAWAEFKLALDAYRQASEIPEFEALRRIEEAAREFLTACDEYGCSDAPLDRYATLVEAVSGLPDGREPA